MSVYRNRQFCLNRCQEKKEGFKLRELNAIAVIMIEKARVLVNKLVQEGI